MYKGVTGNRSVRIILAYGYFFLLSLAWLVMSSFNGTGVNITAGVMVLVSAGLFYFNHQVAHLVAGVVLLFCSFFMVMQVISAFGMMGKGGLDVVSGVMLAICAGCVAAASLLIVEFYMRFKKTLKSEP